MRLSNAPGRSEQKENKLTPYVRLKNTLRIDLTYLHARFILLTGWPQTSSTKVRPNRKREFRSWQSKTRHRAAQPQHARRPSPLGKQCTLRDTSAPKKRAGKQFRHSSTIGNFPFH